MNAPSLRCDHSRRRMTHSIFLNYTLEHFPLQQENLSSSFHPFPINYVDWFQNRIIDTSIAHIRSEACRIFPCLANMLRGKCEKSDWKINFIINQSPNCIANNKDFFVSLDIPHVTETSNTIGDLEENQRRQRRRKKLANQYENPKFILQIWFFL